MKYETAAILIAFFGLATASPLPRNKFTPPSTSNVRREVPQEHSHEKFLTSVRTSVNLDNPQGLVDPVFGLLGNAAAMAGLGKTTDPDCLQQNFADQAFTNAKAAKDVDGMANALLYRAIERNTGGVGVASVICTATAVNPEIAALTQHQDPASEGAAAKNKAITLELAKQLAAVGADPQLALQAGTFAPGDLADNTGAGNTCDDADDPEGCIFTKKLLVEDATAAEIDAAVAGVAATPPTGDAATGTASGETAATSAATGGTAATPDTAAACPAPVTVTVPAGSAATQPPVVDAVPAAAATPAADAAAGNNVQTFTGAIGGIAALPVTEDKTSGRPFTIKGNTFVNKAGALQRSCAIQNNACSDAVNSKKIAGDVSQCGAQEAACNAAAKAAA